MKAAHWLISLALVAIAGLAGWFSAAEYRPPADSGEERLEQRALEFYRASSTFDYETMVQLYTPAQQVADSEELNKKARRWKDTFEVDFDEDHRRDLLATADALTSDDLEIRLEGDWALITGLHDVYAEGRPVRMQLDPSVWVRTGGDWWMYQMSVPELSAYGNPPDFARKILFKREFEEHTMDMNAVEAQNQRQQDIEQQSLKDSAAANDEQDGNGG